MAAAVLCGSRGVIHVCKTKDLFLICTLLSLFCPASSWIDIGKLKEINDNILKLQQDAVLRRADNMVDRIYLPKLFEDLIPLMDNLADSLKSILPQFRSQPNLMQELINYMKRSLSYLENYFQKEAARTQEYEDMVKQLERVIEKLAEEANM